MQRNLSHEAHLWYALTSPIFLSEPRFRCKTPVICLITRCGQIRWPRTMRPCLLWPLSWMICCVLPWNKGVAGVKWRDLDEAVYFQCELGAEVIPSAHRPSLHEVIGNHPDQDVARSRGGDDDQQPASGADSIRPVDVSRMGSSQGVAEPNRRSGHRA